MAGEKIGILLCNLRQYPEAIVQFDQLVRTNPNDASAHYGLGYAYFEEGQYEEAVEAFSDAIALRPEYAEAYFARGHAYHQLDEKHSAGADRIEAIRLRPAFRSQSYRKLKAGKNKERTGSGSAKLAE